MADDKKPRPPTVERYDFRAKPLDYSIADLIVDCNPNGEYVKYEALAAETERADRAEVRAEARVERLKHALAQILLECGDVVVPGEALSTIEDIAHGALRHDH